MIPEIRKLAETTIDVFARAQVGYAARLRFAAEFQCSPCKIRLGGWTDPLRGNSQRLGDAKAILKLNSRPEFLETSQVIFICQDGHALALQLPAQLVEEGDHIVARARERIDFLQVSVTVPLLNELFHGVSHSGPVLRVESPNDGDATRPPPCCKLRGCAKAKVTSREHSRGRIDVQKCITFGVQVRRGHDEHIQLLILF